MCSEGSQITIFNWNCISLKIIFIPANSAYPDAVQTQLRCCISTGSALFVKEPINWFPTEKGQSFYAFSKDFLTIQ